MTNSKNIALYQLGLGSLKTYLLAAAFVIGNIALPQLCHLSMASPWDCSRPSFRRW